MIESVYIHIPFCNNICSYCDFCKLFYNKRLVNEYLTSLKKEINEIYKGEKIKTLYIGGGTPSALSIDELNRLFDIIKIFELQDDYEFTIECNFDSINSEKLKLFKRNGINRISFGLESTVKNNLDILERKVSKEFVIFTINECKKLGINNINIDLMYAIPGETLEDLNQDLDFILSLNVTHVSTYSLIIEEHTKLSIKNTEYISEDLDYDMYKLICTRFREKYTHYEISNFSKHGYESKHNLCYWKNKNYYGFGLGASSYIDKKRINNTRSLNKYLNGNYILDYENLNKSDIMSYEMILGLRINTGVNKLEFYNKYKINIEDAFDIKHLVDVGLLQNKNNIFIPEDKWYISNEVLVEFVKE